MYADRFTGQSRFSPGGLAAAVGINAGVVAALMVAAPYVGIVEPDDPIDIYAVPIDPVSEPQPRPEPRQRASRSPETPDAPTPRVETPTSIDRPTVFDPLHFRGRLTSAARLPAPAPDRPSPILPRPRR